MKVSVTLEVTDTKLDFLPKKLFTQRCSNKNQKFT